VIGICPFFSIPLMGAFFYFRHDDSEWLAWARGFTRPFFDALSPDPAVNMTASFGMAEYWRPFVNLYILGLWHLLGLRHPGIYHVIAGVAFILAVLVLFRLSEKVSGLPAAVTACLLFFAAFHGVMYNLFHIGVPVTFLFQMCLVFFFWRFVEEEHWPSLAGVLLFLVPAMSRQTSILILAGLLSASLINHRKTRKLFSWIHGAAAAVILTGLWMLTFSTLSGKGSIVTVLPDPAKALNFLQLRVSYYGEFLSSGITGFFIIFLLSGGLFDRILSWRKKGGMGHSPMLWILPALPCALLFTAFPMAGIYWIIACMITLFVIDSGLRMPLAWACASFFSFLAISYFHIGYLVEAGFPFSLAMGILLVRLFKPIFALFVSRTTVLLRRLLAIGTAALALALVLGAVLGARIPTISTQADIVRLTVRKNIHFRECMRYLETEMPAGAVVYELNEYDLGTTAEHSRFFSPMERVVKIKIMNLEDKERMLELAGRTDVQLVPAWRLPGADLPPGSYFLTSSGFEKNIALNRYHLSLIRTFGDSEVGCAVFEPAPAGQE